MKNVRIQNYFRRDSRNTEKYVIKNYQETCVKIEIHKKCHYFELFLSVLGVWHKCVIFSKNEYSAILNMKCLLLSNGLDFPRLLIVVGCNS